MQTHSTTKWKDWSRNPYFSPYLYLWRSFPQRHTTTPTAYCRLRERFQLSDQFFFLLYISVFASQIHFTTVQSFMNMTFSWCSSLDLDMSAITSLRNPHPLGTTHNKEKKEWGESFASINLFSFRQKPVSQWCQICVGMLKHNSSPLSLAMFFPPNQGNYLFGYHFFSSILHTIFSRKHCNWSTSTIPCVGMSYCNYGLLSKRHCSVKHSIWEKLKRKWKTNVTSHISYKLVVFTLLLNCWSWSAVDKCWGIFSFFLFQVLISFAQYQWAMPGHIFQKSCDRNKLSPVWC